MPRGVYDRKKYMKTFGRGKKMEPVIVSMRLVGMSCNEICKALKISKTTVARVSRESAAIDCKPPDSNMEVSA